MTGISVHVFSTLKSTLQASDEDCVFGLMFEEMLIEKTCVRFISLAVWRALRTLETTAGQAILQIMHALVFMLHGSYNKWLIT